MKHQETKTEKQLHIQKTGAVSEGKETIFHMDRSIELDGLTWAAWGEASEEGIQLNIKIGEEDYGVIRCSTPDSFVGNSPYHIASFPAPQWTVLEYDTGKNKYAFNFNETPLCLPEGCTVEIEHRAGRGEEIYYSVRLRGREIR